MNNSHPYEDATKHEKFIKMFPEIFSKEGKKVAITPFKKNKKIKNFEVTLGQIDGVSPNKKNVVLFEQQYEGHSYQVFDRRSMGSFKLDGKPYWSETGDYFVAINNDLETGFTENMAEIYKCTEKCIPIYDLLKKENDLIIPKDRWNSGDGVGGKSAAWNKEKVKITLVQQKNIASDEYATNEITKECTVLGEKVTCVNLKH